MFVSNAGERCDQYNHHQTDQAHFGNVECQCDDQNQRSHALYDERGTLTRSTLGIVFVSVVGQHGAYVVRQQRAVTEPAHLFQNDAGHQACHQHWQGHRSDLQKELREVPAHLMADQQVLRFAHQRANATQCGADCAVHQQAAQESAELIQVAMMQRGQILVIAVLAVLTRIGAGGNAVIHRIETHGGADDHGGHGQGIEKRRQERRQKAEHQRQ
ncbi:hypothetical protein D3C85_936540 [compost metagenome]